MENLIKIEKKMTFFGNIMTKSFQSSNIGQYISIVEDDKLTINNRFKEKILSLRS